MSATKFLGDLTALYAELGLTPLAQQQPSAVSITGGSIAGLTVLSVVGTINTLNLLAASATISGSLTANAVTVNSTVASSALGAQFIAPGYMHYSDGGSYYFLLTGSNTPTTAYNGLRPFYINFSSGLVSMASGLSVTGGNISFAGMLTVGNGVGVSGNQIYTLASNNTFYVQYTGALNLCAAGGTSTFGGAVTIGGRLTIAAGNYLVTGCSASTYGSITISGNKNSWAGININDNSGSNLGTWMVGAGANEGSSVAGGYKCGFYDEPNSAWTFAFDSGANLVQGYIPASRISGGTLPGSYTFANNTYFNSITLGNSVFLNTNQIYALGTPFYINFSGNNSTLIGNSNGSIQNQNIMYGNGGGVGTGFAINYGASTLSIFNDTGGHLECDYGLYMNFSNGASSFLGGPTYVHTSSPAGVSVAIGYGIGVGWYHDTINLAMRSPSSSGCHYFQSAGGADTYMVIGPTQGPNSSRGMHLSGGITLGGNNQNSTTVNTQGGYAGSIYIQDTGSAAYNGGTIVFGAAQGFFAALKGALTDGGGLSRGDLYMCTRPDESSDLQPVLWASSNGFAYVAQLAGSGNRAVYSDGNGGLVNSASDGRLKSDVKVIDPRAAMVQVKALRPILFNWIDASRGTQREVGLIAQEVRAIVPEVVGSNRDGTLSVDYPKLVATLIAATQFLEARVTELETCR